VGRVLRNLSKDFCYSVVSSCTSRGDLQRKDESVYMKCRRTGWLDEWLPKPPKKDNSPKAYGYKYQKAWKKKNRDYVLEKNKEYNSRPCTITKRKIRRELQKCDVEALAKRAEYERRRNFVKKASQCFLTEDRVSEMVEIYRECRILSEKTGVKHHVDHIVPLRGKDICGLHVPWNLQIITAEENIRKSNSFKVGGY
jgi:hypothetical protein